MNRTPEPCIAVSAEADFEAGTWTFEPVTEFRVGAGRFAIIRESDYLQRERENATLRAALEAHGKEAVKSIAWLSQAHVLCSDLGVAPGHIEDQLFEAIGNAATLMAQRDELLAIVAYYRHQYTGHEPSHSVFNRMVEEYFTKYINN